MYQSKPCAQGPPAHLRDAAVHRTPSTELWNSAKRPPPARFLKTPEKIARAEQEEQQFLIENNRLTHRLRAVEGCP